MRDPDPKLPPNDPDPEPSGPPIPGPGPDEPGPMSFHSSIRHFLNRKGWPTEPASHSCPSVRLRTYSRGTARRARQTMLPEALT
jgi:hypothetical protein